MVAGPRLSFAFGRNVHPTRRDPPVKPDSCAVRPDETLQPAESPSHPDRMRAPGSRLTLSIALLTSGCAHAAAAPARTPASVPGRGAGSRFVGAWLGGSPDSPTRGGIGGTTPDREFVLAGLRAEWVLDVAGPVALAATADLVPLAVVTRTPTYRPRTVVPPDPRFPTFTYPEQTGARPVYGAGASPFGLALYAPRGGRVRAFAGAAAGGLWFTRNTPVPDARRFNFTAEFGGGIELARASGGALVLAYKRHHLSNAGSAPANPGLDANVVYVGILRRRRPTR